MPDTWNHTPLSELWFVANQLRSAADSLEEVCKSLSEAGIDHAWTFWTDAVPRKASSLKTFAEHAKSQVNDQITAKRLGIAPEAEIKKTRSSSEMARRKEALARGLAAAKPANDAALGLPAVKKKKVAKKKGA